LDYTKKEMTRVALVTGSARRIGAAIISEMHRLGYRVAIHCHHSFPEAEEMARVFNNERADSARVFQADLSVAGARSKLIEAVCAWSDNLYALVNNASLFVKDELATFETLFALNVQAPFELSLSAQPWLAKQGGCIVNITDIHADKPLKGYAMYSQTKAALRMQTRALAKAFAPKIRVNAVAPGAIAWPEKDNALTEVVRAKIIAETPLQCHGQPAYIAQAVSALIDNPFITGQTLAVDGGRSLG